ncbi:hypothetical protein B0H14DRAFT_2993667, partial [Mycena olivaceomarginata]
MASSRNIWQRLLFPMNWQCLLLSLCWGRHSARLEQTDSNRLHTTTQESETLLGTTSTALYDLGANSETLDSDLLITTWTCTR